MAGLMIAPGAKIRPALRIVAAVAALVFAGSGLVVILGAHELSRQQWIGLAALAWMCFVTVFIAASGRRMPRILKRK